jgi:hypothetical protein
VPSANAPFAVSHMTYFAFEDPEAPDRVDQVKYSLAGSTAHPGPS